MNSVCFVHAKSEPSEHFTISLCVHNCEGQFCCNGSSVSCTANMADWRSISWRNNNTVVANEVTTCFDYQSDFIT